MNGRPDVFFSLQAKGRVVAGEQESFIKRSPALRIVSYNGQNGKLDLQI